MGSLLVLESRARWREHIRVIADFLGITLVSADNLATLRGAEATPRELVAVLVGEVDSPDEALDIIRARFSNPPVYLLTENGQTPDTDLLVRAQGMIELPLRRAEFEALFRVAQRTGSRRSPELFRNLAGDSPAISAVRRMIEQVADADANVLILGESGTGKEVVARKLHYFSSRRDKPFVPINCGAIPGDLLESELFGHEKGAFTGAISARQGRFELAEGGTLFLDEIGDMSLHMQVKLLRVLQERVFERVGSNRTIEANVRIIAATHRNLEQAIRDGKFREDLYYRLNVFPIEMPPLRERAEDLPQLVEELIQRFRTEKGAGLRLSTAAMTALQHYEWPGNVRELANLIERLSILHPGGIVELHQLPEKFSGIPAATAVATKPAVATAAVTHPVSLPRLPTEGLDIKEHLASLEVALIRQALDEANGVVAHAAERLKLRRTTLVEKLRKYGLSKEEDEVSNF